MRDAGFSAPETQLTAVGTLAAPGDPLRLEMRGGILAFVLVGGEKVAELMERCADLVGWRLRVIGKLHPSHGEHPPGLTVERWEVLAEKASGP